MKPLSIVVTSLLLFSGGAGLGMVGLWTWQARQPTPATPTADLKPLQAQIALLRSELETSRAKIAALEASAAAAKLVAGSQRFSGAKPEAPAGPVDLNQVFEQAKPLLKSLSPMLDQWRKKGAKAWAEARVAELTKKYPLTADQQAAVKKWFEDKSDQESERGKSMMDQPGMTLDKLIASGRGQAPEDGLDEFMQSTLTADQLPAYQADRLHQRAGNVEKEATRKVDQLDKAVGLDEAQKDRVFGIMARSSRDYDASMQLEGLGSDTGAFESGQSRDEAIRSVLTPEQSQNCTTRRSNAAVPRRRRTSKPSESSRRRIGICGRGRSDAGTRRFAGDHRHLGGG